jgi:hypothetical protein
VRVRWPGARLCGGSSGGGGGEGEGEGGSVPEWIDTRNYARQQHFKHHIEADAEAVPVVVDSDSTVLPATFGTMSEYLALCLRCVNLGLVQELVRARNWRDEFGKLEVRRGPLARVMPPCSPLLAPHSRCSVCRVEYLLSPRNR